MVEGRRARVALASDFHLMRVRESVASPFFTAAEVENERSESLGLGQTDNVRMSSSTNRFFPSFFNVLILTYFLDIVS